MRERREERDRQKGKAQEIKCALCTFPVPNLGTTKVDSVDTGSTHWFKSSPH